MNRLVATTILKNYNANVETTINGKEAVKLLKSKHFDLVLMDVQMPVMDGLKATSLIRKEISKSLPIIALTAFALKGDQEKFLNAGMQDYLSKPFGENQLLNVVSRWLELPEDLKNQKNPLKEEDQLLYNLSSLENIAQGNKEFVDQMIELFIRQSYTSITEIKEAYSSEDFEKVSKIAHRIKPSIDNMGIAFLKTEIREIESKAQILKTSTRLKDLINKLDEVLLKTIKQLKNR
jgi:CheY-like chemotaxis protein/HPt (histidine-containing phosphotransfer) domain-containing protein